MRAEEVYEEMLVSMKAYLHLSEAEAEPREERLYPLSL